MGEQRTSDTEVGVEWPSVADFDLDEMKRAGWSPTPLSEFVVKVASRCNLNCDYCYVYHGADQSWRIQPKIMSMDTVRAMARRIREHAIAWEIPRVGVSFHGGEPLLAGMQFFEDVSELLHRELDDVCDLLLMCQTNATLITPEIAKVLARRRIRVGVSLDGGQLANDRHRRYRNGRSSFDDVLRGIEVLRAAGEGVFAGVLATIDLRNDPAEVYRTIVELDPKHCDFLFPHGNWETLPPLKSAAADDCAYADWLAVIFDLWYSEPQQPVVIRIFQDIMNLLLGGVGGFEMVGNTPISLVSIETDGSIELVDTLKTTYDGAAVTNHTLQGSSLDAVLAHPGVVARQIGIDALAPECLRCRFRDVCGGGMYTHRYRAGTGFKNPSVFCADLYTLIDRIENRMRADLIALGGAPA